MDSDVYNISIIVIGYNTLSTLPDTINSINNLNVDNQNIEVIYVDDGSTDGSYEYFKNSKLNFKKLNFGFQKNYGRAAARLKGIEMASGEWLLFLNSNIIVNPNIIIEYSKSISTSDGLAFAGCLNYHSLDFIFSKYLNQTHRGIKKYNQHEVVNYQNFLFSNCMVQKSIMSSISFNASLRYYGGEELDWSYRFNKQFPDMIRASKLAVAMRNNHPSYRDHLKKMVEFGATNFVLLEPRLQIDVVRYQFLLNKNIFFRGLFNLLYIISILLYGLPLVGNYIVKVGLMASVLRGYYRNKI